MRIAVISPLGYHLANAAVLLCSTVLLYLVARELQKSRAIALAVAVVYALLPHYSTARFWIAAYQAPLSIALYFLSLYAELRAVPSPRTWAWRLLAVLSLVASGLAYEVALPLFLLNPLLVWCRGRQLQERDAGQPLAAATTLLALLAVVALLRPSDRLSWRRAGDKILASGNRTETTRYAWALQDSNLTGQKNSPMISASSITEIGLATSW